MIVSLFLVALKYLGLLVLSLVLYLTAVKIIPAYIQWNKYKKYPNVHTTTFIPLLGDFWPIMKNLNAGIKYYNHLDQKVYDMKDKDLELMFEGDKPCLQIFSHQAHKEFEQLIPHKIDRFPEEEHIGQMVHKTIGNVRFDKLFNFRKRTVLKLLSIGKSSLYIPRMIKSCQWLTESWGDKDVLEVNCSKDMFKLNFNVFIKILLGNDNIDMMNTKHPYENEDGTFTMMTLGDYTLKTSDAFIDQFLNPLTMIFPFINKYKLCNPYKRNHRNLAVLQDWIQKMIENTQDELSMVYSLKKLDEIPPEVLLDDIIGYILAGADTSAHSFCATLYQLKKNPEKLEKLMAEIKEHGFDKDSNMDEAISWEKIDQMDYLNNCLKEGMRLDPPGVDSLGYEAVEDVEICGVPFKKGQYMKINLYASNHSPVEHQKPHDYIPERFDPESEYFTKPGSNKPRSVYSNIPFSHGPRGCPGYVIAMMQIKVAFIYILSKYNYEIDADFLKKEGMGFALRAGIELHATFTKK